MIPSKNRRIKTWDRDMFPVGKILKIGANFSTRIMGNIVSKILGIITLPIIARALGPEGFGGFNLVIVILGYSALLVDFGFTTYGVRESAKQKDSTTLVSQIISARLTLALGSILVSALLLVLIFSNNIGFVFTVCIGFIWVTAQASNIDFHFFGKKNMLIPTINQISGQIFYVLAVVFLIRYPSQLRLLVLFYSLYYLWASGLGILVYLKKNHSLRIRISMRQAWSMLKKTFRLGISARLEMFLSSFPVIIISALLGTFALGIFSAAFKFYTIILLVFQTIMLALAPYLVKLRDLPPPSQRKYIRLLTAFMFGIGSVGSLILYIGGETLLALFFGKSFGAASPLFKLMCVTLIPFTPVTMVLGSVLIYFDLDRKYLLSTLIAGIATLVLTPILVTFASLKGAIWAISLSNMASLITSGCFVNQVLPGVFGSRMAGSLKNIQENR